MSKPQLYDRIGVGYAEARRHDPAIAAQVLDALGDAQRIVNIGAGTGNHEPADRFVVAVEPNAVMVAQRTSPVPVVRAFAENLPLANDSFDAALAMFTIHHWPDREAGLAEMARVSRRQVSLVYDWTTSADFWLLDYFVDIPRPSAVDPSAEWIAEHLGVKEVRPLMVPADCIDGFTGCYWRRPERYLDAQVQAGMSTLARLSEQSRAEGSQRLRDDLESGAWHERYGHLLELDQYDVGYRLAISGD